MEAGAHEFVLWLMLFAYALHILEERMLDWLGWARATFNFDLGWADFYTTNAIVVVAGICTAMVGWKLPEVSLMFPALALVNGVVFHIGPTLLQRRFSPGVITAVLLFLPIGSWSYYAAYVDRVLTLAVGAVSAVGGAVLMAYPLVLLQIKKRLPSYDK
jgi:hypothetical protein